MKISRRKAIAGGLTTAVLAPAVAAGLPSRSEEGPVLRLPESPVEQAECLRWMGQYPEHARGFIHMLGGRRFTIQWVVFGVGGDRKVDPGDPVVQEAWSLLIPEPPWAEGYYLFCDFFPGEGAGQLLGRIVEPIPDPIPITMEFARFTPGTTSLRTYLFEIRG